MSGLTLSFFTPQRERCGVSDYSRHLLDALERLPEIDRIEIVPAPDDAVYGSSSAAVMRYGTEEGRFRQLGRRMNAAQIAHVQHQYFFFGGVAPYKNHARAFLDAIRIPLVMTVHEIAQPPEGASALLRHAIALTSRGNFLHPAIRALIVHTERDREQLITLGVKPQAVHVVTHAIPPALPMPPTDEAKRALGLEGRRVVTLFGFLSTKKGHRLALEAIPRLPDDIVLLFAGDQHPDDLTDYVPRLRAEIEQQGLADRIRITGYLPESRIPTIMAATDVALAPFLQSSGSGSLANLLAYARPVLASDISPHQEIAREVPDLPALFRSGDASDLAAQLAALLTDSERRARLQAAARAYAARHSYDQMARETAAIYRRLLGFPVAPHNSGKSGVS